MANYGAYLTKGTTSITVGIGSIEAPAAAMRRVALYDVVCGSPAAAADGTFDFQLNRTTTAATGTAVTPNPLDLADPAAVTLAKQNNTVQGTNTAGSIPLGIPQNQRATFRWVARQGSELIIPATAANGFSLNTPTAIGTPAASATILFTEL